MAIRGTCRSPQRAMRIAMASGTARCASNHHVFFNSSYNNRDQLNPYNPLTKSLGTVPKNSLKSQT